MSPLIPQVDYRPEYLTLDELETLAFEFADQGASIIGAEGPRGPEWHLRVKIKGAETTFRAHRLVVA